MLNNHPCTVVMAYMVMLYGYPRIGSNGWSFKLDALTPYAEKASSQSDHTVCPLMDVQTTARSKKATCLTIHE